ncbi:hypothetical protein GCM10023220_25130 [Streptomyces ziwulingensis]|uniref:Uncharacterized protein n=1 Tax=Streptomyces ziwulingensis TaxID=1045501 RepID=A0ABP9BKS6_9ACTN
MVTHRLIGQRVTDGERVGVLTAVDRRWTDPAQPREGKRITEPMAFVRPVGGGVEWTAPPSALRVV